MMSAKQRDKEGQLQYSDVIDELRYRSYRWNRQLTPDIEPEKWALCYGDVTEMENRYQAEYPLCSENPTVLEMDIANHLLRDEPEGN